MKTEIKYESHELIVIRIHRSQTATVFCALCAENVLHLSVARAAAALGVSETAIFRLVENGAVHSSETAAGALLVCGNSLTVWAQQVNFIGGEK